MAKTLLHLLLMSLCLSPGSCSIVIESVIGGVLVSSVGYFKTDFDFVKIFQNKDLELESSFTNQTDRFWKILRNRGLEHLRNTNPPQPIVL